MSRPTGAGRGRHQRAATVIAVSSNWVVNAAAALVVSRTARAGTRVYAHVPDDQALVAAMQTKPDVVTAGVLPELFSIGGIATRDLLLAHPPGSTGEQPRPVVVAGAGRSGWRCCARWRAARS